MSVEFTESKTPGAASRDTATHTQAGRANNRTRDENTITDRKSHDHEQPRLRDTETEYNRPPECQKRPLRNAQAHNPIRRHRYARGRPGHARPGANPRRLRRGRPAGEPNPAALLGSCRPAPNDYTLVQKHRGESGGEPGHIRGWSRDTVKYRYCSAQVAQVAQVGHELERAVRPLVAGARAGRLDRSADRAAMSTRAVPAREVNYLAPCVSSEYPPSELPLSTLSYLL